MIIIITSQYQLHRDAITYDAFTFPSAQNDKPNV